MITLPQSQWTTLTPDQAEAFDRDGFLVVREALDPDRVAACIEAGDRLVASDRQEGRRDAGRSDGFRNVIALDPVFRELLCHPRTVPLVIQLMGPNLQLHTSDLIWKYPDASGEEDKRTPGWHRDIAAVTRDLDHDRMPRLEIKVAYYLTDCLSPTDGQTRVAAGSHRWRTTWQRQPGDLDPAECVVPEMRAGDALLFENRTWHAGGPNQSGRIRKTLMMGYSHYWIRPDDYDHQKPEVLDQCDPRERCLIAQQNRNFDELGRFRPCTVETALEIWAKENGWTAPACH